MIFNTPKGCKFESRAGRNCRWGEWMYSALSTFNITTRCPWARHRTHCPLLRVCVHGVCVHGVCVHGVCVHCCVCVCSLLCVFTAVCVCVHCCVCVHGVCVHFGWVKCRARIPSMGHHTWLYVTTLSLNIADRRRIFRSYSRCVKSNL